MDRWCRDFDNWATCDTLCFALSDRTPHAWRKVESWAKKQRLAESQDASARWIGKDALRQLLKRTSS